MKILTRNRKIVRRARKVVRGFCAPCCGLAPSNHYYKFEACDTGGPFDPCGLSAPYPGLMTIYVAHDLLCSNSGQTIEAMIVAALTAQLTPVIRWAGWCYRFVDSCYFPTCPQTGTLGGACGTTCKVLPINAVGPSGPVVCLTGCDAEVCRSASYVFLRACPGEGALASPTLYLCSADLYPFFAAGGRCPVYQIAGRCYSADWQNASNTKPANYTRLQAAPSHDGCCLCLGPPCVYSEGTGCTNFGGFSGGYDPPGAFPPRCCAHALNGTATASWSFRRYDAFGLSEQRTGLCGRSGLTLSGSWTRLQRIGPGQYQSETFGISGVFAPSSHFNLLGTVGADVNSSLVDKTWAGFPCPVGTGTYAGKWRSTCTAFVSNATVQGSGVRNEFAVNYNCSPNPGVCEAGCTDERLTNRVPTIPPGGPGDSGGLDDAIEDMARRQLGQPCRGCGG